ncbi:MAG: FAD-dependent monooxygenase [Verrucomicrobiae bacterium]|nr:FAD-dependent monooxygenase [Verrucomicrobiae bacterium]
MGTILPMTTDTPLDALVIGAGPTGLAAATDLIRHGMRIRILDKAAAPSPLSKAVVLMPRSLEEFKIRGLDQKALALGEKIHSFSAFNHREIIFRVEYNRASSRYNYLVNIPQSDTEKVLREELTRLGGTIEWNTEMQSFTDHGDHVSVVIKNPDGKSETIQTAYLCGCGGAHSATRHGLNFEFVGAEYQDAWKLADVSIDWRFPHGHSYAFFSDSGLLAVFPMPKGNYRIYTIQPKTKILGRDLTLEDVATTVESIVPGLCKISNPTWMTEFHCHHRHVNSYSRGRVFIGGDAAHIHSPESGLGMNTGIQDSYNLAWKLAYVRKGIVPPVVLDTYSSERAQVGREVVELSDFSHKVSAQFNILATMFRDSLWRFFSHYYKNNWKEFEKGLQLTVHYHPNLVVENHGATESLKDDAFEGTAGTRCIDRNLLPTTPDASPTSLYHLLDPVKFHLLILTGANPTTETHASIKNLISLVEPIREHLRVILVIAGQDSAAFSSCTADLFLDPAMEFHFTYGAQKGGLFLIRPDAYIGLSTRPIRVPEAEKFLRKLFVKLA